MTESQEEKTNYNKFYANVARYFKESKEMAELRKEDTSIDEIEQTFHGAETYHKVLDSANIPYPEAIERSLQVLPKVYIIQKQIKKVKEELEEELKNGRKTK